MFAIFNLPSFARGACLSLLLGVAAAGLAVGQEAPIVVHNAARFIDVALDAQAAQQAKEAKARREAAAVHEAQSARLSQSSRSAHAALANKPLAGRAADTQRAPRFGPMDRSRCYNSCINGLCKRTLASGHIETWQAPRRLDEQTQRWYWDTRTNACGIEPTSPATKVDSSGLNAERSRVK